MSNAFKLLFESIRLGSKLKKISKKLAESSNTQDVPQGDHKDKYLEELIDLAESDKYVKVFLNKYHAPRQILRELYNKLILLGAGRYAGDHYVAAASLVKVQTIKFLLEHFNGNTFSINNLDDDKSAIFIANRLFQYFDKSEYLAIQCDCHKD